MYNDLACFDKYIGENMAKGMKDKWNTWFHKNRTTNMTTTSTTTTTIPPTTSSTTTPSPILNQTTEVISDLSLQEARDGLEFFKIYNDFMLAKLASKLSQDAHERRMLKSVQNQDENIGSNTLPPVFQNPVQVPDLSRIDENDIKVLKELDSCLKNKKTSTNWNGNVPTLKTEDGHDDGAVNEVSNDRRGIYERFLYKN